MPDIGRDILEPLRMTAWVSMLTFAQSVFNRCRQIQYLRLAKNVRNAQNKQNRSLGK